jgi:hypothetical protein
MLINKIRTAAVVLTAVAGAAALPASSEARPNDGRFAHSSEAMKAKLSAQFNCAAAKDAYDLQQEFVAQDIAKQDYVASFQDVDHAAQVRTAAHDAGCGWAWT